MSLPLDVSPLHPHSIPYTGDHTSSPCNTTGTDIVFVMITGTDIVFVMITNRSSV